MLTKLTKVPKDSVAASITQFPTHQTYQQTWNTRIPFTLRTELSLSDAN